MTNRFVLLITLLAASLLLPACRSADAIDTTTREPAYVCKQITGKIHVDGKLDDPDWQQAEVIDRFYPYNATTDPQRSPTSFRMLCDDKYLYVAFTCEDDDIWSCSGKDEDELWNGDVVELFIQTDAGGHAYYEMVIAPSGAIADAHHGSRGGGGFRRFKDWSSHAEVACSINGTDGNWHDTDRSYTVEAAIPLASFDHLDKQPWRFGVFRYNYSVSFDEPQMLMSIPTSPKWGFHYYPGYRPLILSSNR